MGRGGGWGFGWVELGVRKGTGVVRKGGESSEWKSVGDTGG